MIQVGGQAVIEGVMMKAPKSLAVVVRKPNGEIAFKEDLLHPWSDRWGFLKWPVLRGTLTLIETLVQGIQALNYSANQALAEEEEKKELGSWSMFLTMSLAILIGLGLFVALPHAHQRLSGDDLPLPVRGGVPDLSYFRRPHQGLYLYCLYLDYIPVQGDPSDLSVSWGGT